MKKVEIAEKEKISEYLRREGDPVVKVRLICLNLISFCGMSVAKAPEVLWIPKRTIYEWIWAWNEDRYEGLKDKPPSPGRPSKLGKEEMERLREYLKGKPFWTTKEVRILIKERFGVEILEDQVRRILRNKFKMNFSKPYPPNYRRPDNAEEILATNLETVIELLKEKGLREEEIAIGSLDETSPQLAANTVRVWSFGKVRISKNTERIKSNSIGFYAIRGESVSDFLNSSKKEEIAEFLRKVKEANSEYKAIVGILDNFPSHRSKLVKDIAKKMGIYLILPSSLFTGFKPNRVYLKEHKKRVSFIKLIKPIDELKAVIKSGFEKFASSISYAKSWIQKFMRRYKLCRDLCG